MPFVQPETLPKPTPLEQELIQLIRDKGAMPLHDYMTACLQHPKYGYYTQNAVPVGKEGDFITAPEISQLFGECLALWCLEQWQTLDRPQAITLIELGGGRGTLMADLLRAARVLPTFLNALSVVIVDTSASLKKLQKEALSPFQGKIAWVSSLDDIKLTSPTLIIGNEFLDALPIVQYQKINGEWCEVVVEVNKDSNRLAPATRPVNTPAIPPHLQDRDFVEVNHIGQKITTQIADLLTEHTGAAVLIDYGYYDEDAGNTLQALHHHQKISPFVQCGEADLTAHVDFKAIDNIIPSPCEFMTQRVFLKKYGIDLRLTQLLKNASPDQADTLKSGYHRLIDDDQMGTLFKVLTWQIHP